MSIPTPTVLPVRSTLSSDLGQDDSPVHTVGWKTYQEMLKNAGVSQVDIDLIARRNPARLLGLE